MIVLCRCWYRRYWFSSRSIFLTCISICCFPSGHSLWLKLDNIHIIRRCFRLSYCTWFLKYDTLQPVWITLDQSRTTPGVVFVWTNQLRLLFYKDMVWPKVKEACGPIQPLDSFVASCSICCVFFAAWKSTLQCWKCSGGAGISQASVQDCQRCGVLSAIEDMTLRLFIRNWCLRLADDIRWADNGLVVSSRKRDRNFWRDFAELVCECVFVWLCTSSTAQGGGSFKNRLVVVSRGWQSEDTDRQVVELSSLSVPFLLFLRLSTYLPI